MSGRIRVRRHLRSAQSRGWAVQPKTLALFMTVVLAVILMQLGMGLMAVIYAGNVSMPKGINYIWVITVCLLYTSDAADE